MNERPPQEWFEMPEVRRRRLAASVWIPLRRAETIGQHGQGLAIGAWEDLDCLGSVAVSAEHRDIGERLGWSDIGLSRTPGPYASSSVPYKPADVHWYNDGQPIGINLVLVHQLNGDHENEWLVNQDLVMALGLLQEGDVWRRVNEGYEEVIRRRRDNKGDVIAIEIKSEFLRDYLCARGMALRVAQYRQRMAILADASYLPWSLLAVETDDEQGRFSGRVFGIDADGGLAGGGVAVMQVWRTDIDHGEDVPVFGRENESNTASRAYSYEREGPKAFRAEGELWREEWIEPAPRSVRVRGDAHAEELHYIVDAAGERLPCSALNDEDAGRWLWFRPHVIEALLAFRGAGLNWYSRNSGSVKCSPDYETHFGINRGGYINVYAYDVARLPQWQQRIWFGYNVAPDGPVSEELMASQMGAGPAGTRAPERLLAELIGRLDELFEQRHGSPLFRPHRDKDDVLRRIHRFRALTPSGLLSLAKDVARVTADSIDIALLRKLLQPRPEQPLGSLKLLQALLGKTTGDDAAARQALGPLVGIYDLRLGDAHLASSAIGDAYVLVGIDTGAQPIAQALTLLDQACVSLAALDSGLRS
jgi:hypothetical protein